MISSRIIRVFLAFIPVFIFSNQVSAYEHPSYDIRMTIHTSEKKITANQKVTFTNNSSKPINEMYFHIYPNRHYTPSERNLLMRFSGYFKVNPYPEGFPEPNFKIRSIIDASGPRDFFIEGKDNTILRVPLERPLRNGETTTLQIDFTVGIPHAYGRFGWHANIIQMSRWYPILSALKDGEWKNYEAYPFHRPFMSDASRYRVELTLPKNQVVIHSGELAGQERDDSLTKTLVIEAHQPIREFTMAVSNVYKKIEEDFGGIKIKSFYLPGDKKKGEEALKIVKDLMEFYTERFSTTYPYKEFSIAPVHLGYGGEQMANLIFIDTRVYKLPKLLNRHFDFLIAHETGHQWLYNLLGIDEYTQLWLEEGLNSFFIMEYLEHKYGENASVLEWPEKLESWKWMLPEITFRRGRDFRHKIIARIGFDHPIIGELGSFREPSSIFSVAYGKGSRVVGMLENYLGKDVFSRVLKRMFEEYQYKILDVNDFIRICEEEKDEDLSFFFDAWLYSKKQLNYAVKKVQNNVITIENKGEISMPVDIEVTFKDGQSEKIRWDGKAGPEYQLKVSNASGIQKVIVDPDEILLDIDQTNNSWPRTVHIHPVPIYLGLYDIPVLLPDDGYNVVFGPEIKKGLGFKSSLQKPYDQILYAGTSYEFGEELHHSRIGYQLNNLFHSQTALGVEIANRTDNDDGEEDLVSGKLYLRRELWPIQYGLGEINDHVSLYLLRNYGLNERSEFFHAQENDRNLDFSRRDETIIGTTLHLNRAGPYPDPREGYKIDTTIENAGHFLGGTQSFTRTNLDVSAYKPVTKRSTLAVRMKYGWGSSNDKDLFHLGGIDGLRGYERKEVRGANAMLGSIEYRFPLRDDINVYALDNIFGLDSIGGVVFFDAGQSWFSDFDESTLKKDAGVGLRWTVDIGAFLEKIVLRTDVAFPINEEDDDTQFWFGVNNAF